MCCLALLLLGLGPRIGLAAWWIFGDKVDAAFDSFALRPRAGRSTTSPAARQAVDRFRTEQAWNEPFVRAPGARAFTSYGETLMKNIEHGPVRRD